MVKETQPVMVKMTLAEFKEHERKFLFLKRELAGQRVRSQEREDSLLDRMDEEQLVKLNQLNNYKSSNTRLRSMHEISIKKHKIFSAVCFIGAILSGIGMIILW